MTSTEPRQTRTPRSSAGTAAVDTVAVHMSFDEADAFTVVLAEACEVWQKHGEQTHSARLNAMHIRTLRNKVTQIREQLPESYGQVDL